jgi:hypothetical protein
LRLKNDGGSRRKVVFEKDSAAAGVVGTVDRRSKELWENRFLVFPQLRQFPQRFSLPPFRYADCFGAEKSPGIVALGSWICAAQSLFPESNRWPQIRNLA